MLFEQEIKELFWSAYGEVPEVLSHNSQKVQNKLTESKV